MGLGITPSGIIAPSVFDGPINGESFLAYVEQMLEPELSERLLRKARQRTITTVWQIIAQLLSAFSPEECQNYFINAGWSRLKS